MAILTADQDVTRKEAGLQSFPVTDGEIIYKGALVCTDPDGYLIAAADVHGKKFAGVAVEKADNSAGGDGAKECRVYTEGVFLLTCTSITQNMVGQLLFVTDDDVVDDQSNYYICAGLLVRYVSATQGWVDIGQRSLGTGFSRTFAASSMESWKIDDIFTYATSGVHKSIDVSLTYQPDPSGHATPIAIVGKVSLGEGMEYTGGQGAVYGVQGQVNFKDGATINQANAVFAGLRGAITREGTPVFNDFDTIAGLYVDNLCTIDLKDIATGYGSALASLQNHGGWLDHGLFIRGGNKITNVFAFAAIGGGALESGLAATNNISRFRIDIDGTEWWINIYN